MDLPILDLDMIMADPAMIISGPHMIMSDPDMIMSDIDMIMADPDMIMSYPDIQSNASKPGAHGILVWSSYHSASLLWESIDSHPESSLPRKLAVSSDPKLTLARSRLMSQPP